MIMAILAFCLYCTTFLSSRASAALESTAWQKGTSWNTEHRFNITSPVPLPLWGSYRPGIYFGMKTRSPVALSTGIMWATTRDGRNSFRHDTRQDQLTQFEWVKHDGKHYGQQKLIDKSYNMAINTTFLVRPVSTSTSTPSELIPNSVLGIENELEMKTASWVQRISVKSIDKNMDKKKSVLFYLGFEGLEGEKKKTEFLSDIGVLGNPRSLRLTTMKTTKSGAKKKYEHDVYLLAVIGKSTLSGYFRLMLTVTTSKIVKKEKKLLEGQELEPEVESPKNLLDISFLGLNCGDVTNGVEHLQQALSTSFYSPDNLAFATSGHLKNTIDSASDFLALQFKSENNFSLDSVFYENIVVQNVTELEQLVMKEMRNYSDILVKNYSEALVKNEKKISTDIVSEGESVGESLAVLKSDIDLNSMKADGSDGSNLIVDKSLIDKWIQHYENKFNQKFDTLYNLQSKNYRDGERMFFDADIEAGKKVLSSLLGGIGYFYGSPR